MLTKNDLLLIKQLLQEEFQGVRSEMRELKLELKNDIEQLWVEMQNIRNDMNIVIAYRQDIEDQEVRITALEKKRSSN